MRFGQKVIIPLFQNTTPRSQKLTPTKVNYIWDSFNGDWYGFFTQNCQNFVYMLFSRIADTSSPRNSFEHIPDPIGYRLADGAQLALATKIATGGKAAYVGAMGTKAWTTAAGTMGATTSGSGVAAAGSTAGTATATTSASTMGAASTTGASGAIGGSTVAGSNTAASTTAAATSSTAATSTTASASGASHIGLGAKAATIGTKAGAGLGTKSALGAKAVAIGSGMMKVGLVAAWTHPVTSLAMTGGLAHLAFRGRGGRDGLGRIKT